MAIDYSESRMSALHLAVWRFLLDNYVGPGNASPRAGIIARFNVTHESQGFRVSDRTFRHVVSELVTEFKKPICTVSSDGYFIARTQKELEQAVHDLEARGGAIFERARVLRDTIPLQRQESLF